MKLIKTLILCIACPVVLFSQTTKDSTISEIEIGPLKCSYVQNIYIPRHDTINFIYIGFKNKQYDHIIDRKSIMLAIVRRDSSFIFSFISDLHGAIGSVGKSSDLSWYNAKYSIRLRDQKPDIYLQSTDNLYGYTTIDKGQAVDLMGWFEKIGFKR